MNSALDSPVIILKRGFGSIKRKRPCSNIFLVYKTKILQTVSVILNCKLLLLR